MNAAEILRDRYALLGRRLDGLERALGLKQNAQSDWAQRQFARRIAERRDSLKLAWIGGVADNLAWQGWVTEEGGCQPLFNEALIWLHARERPAFEPDGPIMFGRALIRELAENCRPSIGAEPELAPDVADSFSDFVQIIRFRFPPGDFWDVPILAHEFGHFAAGFLRSRTENGLIRQNALGAFVAGKQPKQPPPQDQSAHPAEQATKETGFPYLWHEFFADVFATYAVGPAYAMSALLLRFDVARAYRTDDPTHPSYAARAVAILETIERMTEEDKGLSDVASWLRDQWTELLKSAESATEVEAARQDASDLLDAIRDDVPDVKYQGWPAKLEPLQGAFFPERTPIAGTVTARDLLNAAWMARAWHGVPQATVADRARELWRQKLNV
jgi:hypothetical protein